MAFQIALDLKLHAKRIVLARFAVPPHAAEAAMPFHCRAIGDDAQLACHAHAIFRITRFVVVALIPVRIEPRSEEHTSELKSLMRLSYADSCLKQKTTYDM